MPRVLAYNLTGQKADLIRMHCFEAGIAFMQVPPQCYGMVIGDLLAHFPEFAGTNGSGFSDEMLLFDDVSDELLHPLLRKIRQAGGVELKAVVTEHNIKWTSCQLRDELARERNAFIKAK